MRTEAKAVTPLVVIAVIKEASLAAIPVVTSATSRAVTRARGGQTAPVYIGDQTRGDGLVRTLAEQVAATGVALQF